MSRPAMEVTDQRKARILVVEDDLFSRELAVGLLEAAGYTVLQAEDGSSLVERVKAERPALILLDLLLPGMNGLTLARLLKADSETRDIPILAMTAYALPGGQALALQAGCDGYFRKPLDTWRLVNTVDLILGF